jgi:hypothetical protein
MTVAHFKFGFQVSNLLHVCELDYLLELGHPMLNWFSILGLD